LLCGKDNSQATPQLIEERVEERKKFFLSTSIVFASYIVHIYRFEKDNPKSLVGVVEKSIHKLQTGVEVNLRFWLLA